MVRARHQHVVHRDTHALRVDDVRKRFEEPFDGSIVIDGVTFDLGVHQAEATECQRVFPVLCTVVHVEK